jgi:hypothetical protein
MNKRIKVSASALAAPAFLLAGMLAAWPSTAWADQTTCTPGAGYSNCVEFTYTGADQAFTLPANAIADNVEVKLWAAGGGGDYNPGGLDVGGGGGYAQGVVDLTGDPAVTVIVGQGGDPSCADLNQITGSLVSTYGGGGAAGTYTAGDYWCGGSGGGRSAIQVDLPGNTSVDNEVLTAGGGAAASDGTGNIGEQAGPGGGAAGAAGACSSAGNPSGASNCQAGAGEGATSTGGGAAGASTTSPADYVAPTSGTQFQGGTGGCGHQSDGGSAGECGGGGGGGYFGGGGGNFNTAFFDAPGGGGSGHVDPVVSSGSMVAATGATSAGSSEPQYVAGIGDGTDYSTADGNAPEAGNGLVVLEFNVTTVGTPMANPEIAGLVLGGLLVIGLCVLGGRRYRRSAA